MLTGPTAKLDLLTGNNNNIHLLKIDKLQLNTDMLKVKVIHTQ